MNVGLCGLGKAGREFVNYTLTSDEFILRDVICREESTTANKTVTEVLGIVMPRIIRVTTISEFDNANNLDVIVDFSNSKTSMSLLDLCCEKKINLVICTTDFTAQNINFIKEKTFNAGIGVVYAPALTIGINILINFVKNISGIFREFNFEIIERHGKNKPKPTRTAQIISKNVQNAAAVQINSVRLDGYVGIHEVTATDGFERLSIVHESFSRSAFVRGALLACRYIHNKEGFYTMSGILDELLTRSITFGHNSTRGGVVHRYSFATLILMFAYGVLRSLKRKLREMQ